jgi:hypothetical protein
MPYRAAADLLYWIAAQPADSSLSSACGSGERRATRKET